MMYQAAYQLRIPTINTFPTKADHPTTKFIMGFASDLRQMLAGQIFQTPSLPTVDLTGQTIIITGANSGLGFEAAKHL
jgi:hypothetical protein